MKLFLMKKTSYKYIKFANKIGGKNGGISKKGSDSEIKRLLLILYYYSKMTYIRLQKQD